MAEPKYKYRQQEQVTVRNHNEMLIHTVGRAGPFATLFLKIQLF